MAAGRFFNDGQEIVISDFNGITAAIERQLFGRLAYQLVSRKENAFFGDSCLVSYTSANSVVVKSGLGLQTDSTQVSPESTIRPIVVSVDTSLTITTPHATLGRIDTVCIKADVAAELTATRNYKDASSGTVTAQSLTVQKDWAASMQIVAGTASGSPAVPATPSGYIKIAELTVTAVSGLSGSGAVSDKRTIMPVGALGTIDSSAFVRLTAGASTTITQLLTDADTLLKFGYMNYLDLDQLDTSLGLSEPGSPSANRRRLFHRDGILYLKDSTGVKAQVGSGGGGGGSLQWQESDNAPTPSLDSVSNRVYAFQAGLTQSLYTSVKIPQGYLAGSPIKLYMPFYSPDSSGTVQFSVTTTLIRPGTTAITSTANQRTSTNAAVTLGAGTVNIPQMITFDVSSTLGVIGLAVAAGDIILINVFRGTDTATSDASLLPYVAELTFS